jgi:hypothetical protein
MKGEARCAQCGMPEYDSWGQETHILLPSGEWVVTAPFSYRGARVEIAGHEFVRSGEGR